MLYLKLVTFLFSSLLLILMSFIFSPMLQEQYLVNCHNTNQKMFTACDVDQSSWAWKIDGALGLFTKFLAPLIAGIGAALVVRKKIKEQSKNAYFIWPLVLLMLLILVTYIFDLLFQGSNELAARQEYLLPIALFSIFSLLIASLINLVPTKVRLK